MTQSEHKSSIRAIFELLKLAYSNNINNLVIWAKRLQKYNTMTNTASAVKILKRKTSISTLSKQLAVEITQAK